MPTTHKLVLTKIFDIPVVLPLVNAFDDYKDRKETKLAVKKKRHAKLHILQSQYIYQASKTLGTVLLLHLIPSLSVQCMLLCQKWPTNQFKSVLQSRNFGLRAHCPNIYLSSQCSATNYHLRK